MEWSEAASVHVEEIDIQHKKLLGLINRAHEINWGKRSEEGQNLLSEFIGFTRVHFTTEENYFTKCNYPGARAHISEHMKYIVKILEFEKVYNDRGCDSEEFLSFLKSWWEDHLIKMDQKYVENFKACGLK